MSKIKSILLVAIFPFAISSTTWGVEVDSYFHQGVVTIAESIEALCPPKECVVIGLGRSPTPLIAYLQLKRLKNEYPLEHAWNLPLSSFRYGSGGRDKLVDAPLAKLFSHFDLYIPNAEELAGRRILLVDYGATGESLVAAETHIKDYLIARSIKTSEPLPKLDVAGIANIALFPTGKHPRIMHWILVDEAEIAGELLEMNKKTLGAQFVGGDFDDLSEFGSFDVRKDEVPSVKPHGREKYYYHQLDLAERMEKPELLNDKLGNLANRLAVRQVALDPFDAEAWLNPPTQKAWELLASQIRFGTVAQQELFYTTAISQTKYNFVSEILDFLPSYRGVSPSRAEIFTAALKSKERDIRNAAKFLFFTLAANMVREPIETSTYLEIFPIMLEAGLLAEKPLMEEISINIGISKEAFIYVGFSPIFKSNNEPLIGRAIELLKTYRLNFYNTYIVDEESILKEIKPKSRSESILARRFASSSGNLGDSEEVEDEVEESVGSPITDILHKEFGVKIW